MKHNITSILALFALLSPISPKAEAQSLPMFRTNVPIDSIRLSDPYVLADAKSHTYYMTGTGGMQWRSKDLKLWDGPYPVIESDPNSWMGIRPMVWAAEYHQYKDKYYCFATFTNQKRFIGEYRGNRLARRASHVMVSDRPQGPYRPMADSTYLPWDRTTLDGTFWVDTDGKPYMVYCWEWLQNWDGTIEKIQLKDDLSGSVGQGKLLFRASESPWSREKDEYGNDRPNRVTDGPFLFRTSTGRLGMLWTSWFYDSYTQGVAYSQSGTLDGPWIQEPNPITPPNYGHGMIFRDFEGNYLLACHSHAKVNGQTIRIPKFFRISLEGDYLRVLGDTNDSYLMVYHKDQDHGLHMAYSRDGYTWTALCNDKPIIAGDTIAEQHGIRDPHIYRAPNGAYYMAMTDLHVFGVRDGIRKTEWERDGKKYGWGNNRGLVFMKSLDLIHWSRTNIDFSRFAPTKYVCDGDTLTMNWREVGCVWAPETVWDEREGKLMVHFTTRQGTDKNTIWYVYMNDDFTKVEGEPHLLLAAPGRKYNIIDSDIIKVADTYHLFYVSHEGGATPKHAVSSNLTGPYRFDDYYWDGERQGHEAPNCWKRNGTDIYVIMFDNFRRKPMNFGFVETRDFFTYHPIGYFDSPDCPMRRTNFSEQKHGSVISLPKQDLDALLEAFAE